MTDVGFGGSDRASEGCVSYTDMSKKVNARLRELAPAARGSQDAGSRNLAFAFFDMSVLLFRFSAVGVEIPQEQGSYVLQF